MKFRVSFLPFLVGGTLLRAPPAFTQTKAASPLAAPPTGTANSASPIFSVASIRLHEGPLQVFEGFTASGPRLTLEGYNRRGLIEEAYNLKSYCVSFVESNLGSDGQSDANYDIAAVADKNDTPTREEFRQMLQVLLADRFKLRFHREARVMPVYALTVAKGGPKFKESAPDQTFHYRRGFHGRNYTATASKWTMESFANDIMQGFERSLPVIDKTGLTGAYEIQFEATPEWQIGDDPQPGDLSLFDAMQEQLGLKLERRKEAVQILVVDHMEEPSEN